MSKETKIQVLKRLMKQLESRCTFSKDTDEELLNIFKGFDFNDEKKLLNILEYNVAIDTNWY